MAGQKRQQVKGIGDRAVRRQLHPTRGVVGIDAVVSGREDGVFDGDNRLEAARLEVAREGRHPVRVRGDAGRRLGRLRQTSKASWQIEANRSPRKRTGSRLHTHCLREGDRPVIVEHLFEQNRDGRRDR